MPLSEVHEDYSAVAFFILRDGQYKDSTVLELLTVAGATEVVPPEDDRRKKRHICTWMNMTCSACIEETEKHRVLHLFYLTSCLDDLREPESENEDKYHLEEDGALSIALAFRDACDAFHVDAAFITTGYGEGSTEWTMDHGPCRQCCGT